MTNLTPNPGWDDVPQLETTTKAQGGVGGPMNAQAQALVNRTEALNPDNQQTPSALDGSESWVSRKSGAWVKTPLAAIASWIIGFYRGFTLNWAGALARPVSNKLNDVVSVSDFGAIGDGSSHPLSGVASLFGMSTSGWTLAQWQTIYPHAQALTDELDWCALQAAVNSATGPFIFRCGIQKQYITNRTIVSGANDILIDLQRSRITNTAGVDCWNHGTTSSPANGVAEIVGGGLETSDYTKKCFYTYMNHGISGGGALKNSLTMRDFRGRGRVHGVNVARGIVLDNAWTSTPVGYVDMDAFTFDVSKYADSTNASSFSYFLRNVQTSGYRFALAFNLLGSPASYPSFGAYMEGVILLGCRAYNGRGLLNVTNQANTGSTNNYQSPLWQVIACDTQGWGEPILLSGLMNVRLHDNYFVIDQGSVPSGITPPSTLNAIGFSMCSEVKARGNVFNVLPNVASQVNLVASDANCDDIIFERTRIYAGAAGIVGFNIAATSSATKYRIMERGTLVLSGSCSVFGTNPQYWSSEYNARASGATMDEGGVKFLQGTFAGTTDGSGVLNLAFPANLFASAPNSMLVSNGDTGAYSGFVGYKRSTLTASGVSLQGAANTAIRFDYIVKGA
ncbi:pectin lyase activity [Burkholderia phage Mica]|uniref:Putative tailspike protein n=1 Tax=Burkholderia phage Mica TaxID=2767579 RepID=A0A873WBI3_9CAUD|nr:pectin lyase activity [Burkholderia phage Mica]QPB08627.1 putative tailspike protein [Burkholderia phage Mica]